MSVENKINLYYKKVMFFCTLSSCTYCYNTNKSKHFAIGERFALIA